MAHVAAVTGFAICNSLGAVACYRVSQRRVVAWIGLVNSAIAVSSMSALKADPLLASFMTTVAGANATAQYGLHLIKALRSGNATISMLEKRLFAACCFVSFLFTLWQSWEARKHQFDILKTSGHEKKIGRRADDVVLPDLTQGKNMTMYM